MNDLHDDLGQILFDLEEVALNQIQKERV